MNKKSLGELGAVIDRPIPQLTPRPAWHIISLKQPATPEELEFLQTLDGLKIIDNESNRTFLVEADESVLAKVRELRKGWIVAPETVYGEPRVL